jgi:single-stranded-DNA-specific exonuclease
MKPYLLRSEVPEDVKKELEAYPDVIAKLLFHRGIETREKAEKFLNPLYERDVYDSFLLKDMDRAAERILGAINNKEKVVIYSDYDADGIPGGVIIHDFFKKIGFENFSNYIPHRHDEGYGLNIDAVERFAEEGVGLIITVDCGIADVVPAKRCKELGIDLIITDHHLPQEVLPEAYATINPKQVGDEYPDKMLCGAGLAFKLVQGILAKERFGIKEGWEKWLLDMAGLSTISDMVPLVDENRALAYFGLKVLRKSPRPGIQKLFRKNGTNQRELDEDDIAFTLTPRINAASRMDAPEDAFRMLATTENNEAETAVNHLNKINDERKGVVAGIVKQAKRHVEEKEELKVIVLGNPQWRPALLGLVANSLVEKYSKSAFVWGRDGASIIKGSCRSDGSVNVVELMSASKEVLSDFGGHHLAGGFSVSHEKVHLLETHLQNAYDKVSLAGVQEDNYIDAVLSIDEVNWDFYRQIEKLSPFGIGNPKPIFLLENLEITDAGEFGKEKNHLSLSFTNSKGDKIKAIKFFAKRESFKKELVAGKKINLLAHLEKSSFGGRRELRLRIVDIM